MVSRIRSIETFEPGDTVILKDDHNFRGRVLAVSGRGNVFIEVVDWGFQTGGYRGRNGVLSKTQYPQSRLLKAEEVSSSDEN